MFYSENIEGYTDYNIERVSGRLPGVSAMLRLANEAMFIKPCIMSILPFFDEIVCCLQNSTDETENIIRNIKSDKIKIFHYPFHSEPNGPGHDKQQRGSVHERAYFYNWCLSKTQYQWVSKWDGDMVALPCLYGLKNVSLSDFNVDIIKFPGIEMVSKTHISRTHPWTASDYRFFRVTPCVYYETGRYSEKLHLPKHYKECNIQAQYLHFKWAKPMQSITKAWPKNWENIPHFQELMNRSEPGMEYTGHMPEGIEI